MLMKDKEIQFVEKLLKAYKSMTAERYNLNIKWSMLERQRDNEIEGEFLNAVPVDGIPGAPHGSYKASPVLISKSGQNIKNEQSFIQQRLKDIEDILTVLNSSLDSLTIQDRQIVIYYYIDKWSLEKIAQIVYLHPRKVWDHKYRALCYLHKSLKTLEGTVIFV